VKELSQAFLHPGTGFSIRLRKESLNLNSNRRRVQLLTKEKKARSYWGLVPEESVGRSVNSAVGGLAPSGEEKSGGQVAED
jgi:hypothetical protein